MANALDKYSKTKFKKDIVVDTEHYSPYIRKFKIKRDLPVSWSLIVILRVIGQGN
jgi:hypothetical protein